MELIKTEKVLFCKAVVLLKAIIPSVIIGAKMHMWQTMDRAEKGRRHANCYFDACVENAFIVGP